MVEFDTMKETRVDVQRASGECVSIDRGAGKISSGSIIQRFQELSPFYILQTKVKVNRYTRNYASLWHFTTGPNCCGMGSRIPGIFIWPDPVNRFQISFQLENDGDYDYKWNFELNTWYEIELSQKKEENNGIVNVSYIYK